MAALKQVTLNKLSKDNDKEVFVDVGASFTGYLFGGMPKAGQGVCVLEVFEEDKDKPIDQQRAKPMVTSMVKSIVSQEPGRIVFKTMNSTYEMTWVEAQA
jgi:hypothetical protein